MLLRNISDFFSLFLCFFFFISIANSLVIHYYPHPKSKARVREREGKGGGEKESRRKMNTKRINYLIKMISPLGHKIMFLFLQPLSYLAQGQGLTSCVCVVL